MYVLLLVGLLATLLITCSMVFPNDGKKTR